MIGDRWRDSGAGKAAGCTTILVNRFPEKTGPHPDPDIELPDLPAAAQWILQSSMVIVWMIVLLFNLGMTGCSRRTQDERHIEPEYDKQTGRLMILKLDSDGNGKTDTISHMDGARVVRIEIDKDEDGRVERWEYYDANQKLEKVGFSRAGDGKEDAWSYARPDGSIARIDLSVARDGKVTRREYYENDAVARAEEDGDGDGMFDKWETYADGRLASVAFDTLHRGQADRRLVYEPNGSARLELDLDGDGSFVAAR